MEKTVLITGANRGFGHALSQVFWGHGWNVIALVRSEDSKTTLEKNFKSRFSVILADINQDQAIKQIQKHLSGIKLDVLINNAAVKGGGKTLSNSKAREIEDSINTNCLGAFRCVQGCIKSLQAAESAKIVNMSSRLGSISKVASGDFDDLKVSYAYRISKAALNMLTSCLASELKPYGIAVCAIHPGKLFTDVRMPDANLSLEEAANRTFRAINQLTSRNSPLFLEPEVDEIQW